MFDMGRIVATPAALDLLSHHQISALEFLRRHVTGDFGDLCHDDIAANLHAVKTGLRILSKYRLGDESVYVITEADRSSTCLLLCDEY